MKWYEIMKYEIYDAESYQALFVGIEPKFYYLGHWVSLWREVSALCQGPQQQIITRKKNFDFMPLTNIDIWSMKLMKPIRYLNLHYSHSMLNWIVLNVIILQKYNEENQLLHIMNEKMWEICNKSTLLSGVVSFQLIFL